MNYFCKYMHNNSHNKFYAIKNKKITVKYSYAVFPITINNDSDLVMFK
jgi:hypothetical protein